MIQKNKQKILAQLIVAGVIFLLFFIGIFVKVSSLLLYFLLLLIIANLILGFINKRRNIFVSAVFLLLYPLLFVVIIEYLATILGAIISLVYALRLGFWYKNTGKKKVKEKK